MLSYKNFSWTFSVRKAQLLLPGFPKFNIKPKGYKPPKMFDPDLDPKTGGFKVGTVRDWAEGPHIKTRDGWFPYDRKTKRVLYGDVWEDLTDHPVHGAAYAEAHKVKSIHPDPVMIHEVADEIEALGNRAMSDPETAEAFSKRAAEVLDAAVDYGSKLSELDKRDALPSSVSDLLFEAVTDLQEARRSVDMLRHDKSSGAIKAAWMHLYNAVTELGNTADLARTLESKKRGGHYFRTVLSAVEDDPARKALAEDEVEEAEMLSHQGQMNTTVIGTTKSGKKVVIKNNSAAVNPGAEREEAMYLLSKAVGMGNVPTTILTEEPLWSAEVANAATEKRTEWGRTNVVDHEEPTNTSVQEVVEGEPFEQAIRTRVEWNDQDMMSLMQMWALDWLSCNPDRNDGNGIVGPEGQWWAIDAGEAFMDYDFEPHPDFLGYMRRAIVENPEGILKADEEVFKRISQLNPEELKRGMSKSHLHPAAVANILRQLNEIKKEGSLLSIGMRAHATQMLQQQQRRNP